MCRQWWGVNTVRSRISFFTYLDSMLDECAADVATSLSPTFYVTYLRVERLVPSLTHVPQRFSATPSHCLSTTARCASQVPHNPCSARRFGDPLAAAAQDCRAHRRSRPPHGGGISRAWSSRLRPSRSRKFLVPAPSTPATSIHSLRTYALHSLPSK